MILPASPNLEFLAGRVDLAMHSRSASANQVQYSGYTNGAGFSAVSPSLPHHRPDNRAPTATVLVSNGSRFTLMGVTLGGILAACFAVLLLSFVPCYLKRRRCQSQTTPANDEESGIIGQDSFELNSLKTMSISRSDCPPQRNPSTAPSALQPSSKTAVLVISRAMPSSEVTALTGDRIRNAFLPARAAPLPPSLGCANREAQQGDSSETAVAIRPPASPPSRVTDERTRKASLPARPPPLLLPPERGVRNAWKSESINVAKSRTICPTNGDNRFSLLPNPWDSNVGPRPAAVEWAFFQLPSFIAPVRPANSFKAGLPRTPRETRNFINVRALVTEDFVDRPTRRVKR